MKILGPCGHSCRPSACVGQQDGKQLLWRKQHSDATCSPAVFPVQFLLFNPSKEIKEQYFHLFALQLHLWQRLGEVGYPSFIKKKCTQLGFILIDNNDKCCRFLLALHSGAGRCWSLGCCGDSSLAFFSASRQEPRVSLTKTLPLQFHNHNPQTKQYQKHHKRFKLLVQYLRSII